MLRRHGHVHRDVRAGWLLSQLCGPSMARSMDGVVMAFLCGLMALADTVSIPLGRGAYEA